MQRHSVESFIGSGPEESKAVSKGDCAAKRMNPRLYQRRTSGYSWRFCVSLRNRTRDQKVALAFDGTDGGSPVTHGTYEKANRDEKSEKKVGLSYSTTISKFFLIKHFIFEPRSKNIAQPTARRTFNPTNGNPPPTAHTLRFEPPPTTTCCQLLFNTTSHPRATTLFFSILIPPLHTLSCSHAVGATVNACPIASCTRRYPPFQHLHFPALPALI